MSAATGLLKPIWRVSAKSAIVVPGRAREGQRRRRVVGHPRARGDAQRDRARRRSSRPRPRRRRRAVFQAAVGPRPCRRRRRCRRGRCRPGRRREGARVSSERRGRAIRVIGVTPIPAMRSGVARALRKPSRAGQRVAEPLAAEPASSARPSAQRRGPRPRAPRGGRCSSCPAGSAAISLGQLQRRARPGRSATSVTRPIASASWASIVRPVRTRSSARPVPTIRGSRCVPPSISGTPQRRSAQPKVAVVVGDAQVAPERELEAAGEAVAGDRGDRRLGRREAGEAERAAGRVGVERLDRLQVGAGAEGLLAGAGEDEHAASSSA